MTRLEERARGRARLRWVLPAADTLSVALGAVTASRVIAALQGFGGVVELEFLLSLVALPLWVGAMTVVGAYRSAYFNAGSDVLRRFLLGTVGGVLSLTFLAFAANLQISRLFVAILTVTALTLGVLSRLAFRSVLLRAYRRDGFTERTLVVGHDAYASDLSRLMAKGSGIPYRAVGLLWMDGGMAARPDDLEVPILDDHEDVRNICERFGVDVVLVASGGLSPEAMRELFIQLENAPQRIVVAPSLFPLLPWRMTVETVIGLPLVHVSEVRLAGSRAVAKRVLDLIGGTLLLTLLSPVLAVGALAVLVDDGRPILFRQTRIGREGRPFELLKLRTMTRDAEAHLDGLMGQNEMGGHFFKIADDPRITRSGSFLRRWSIDEIPQLVSVLKGDMSLVGPRPLFSRPEDYSPVERRRLRVRPGLTGPWQVSGRSATSGTEAIQKDLFYLENWTFLGDLVILARTVSTVLSRRGSA
jgi:exopolysaccharide biosynthesis polyprenyl glycosylphosphotransferase